MKRFEPLLPKVTEGNMFYVPSSGQFGYFMKDGKFALSKRGTPVSSDVLDIWGDEDFYMSSELANSFYEKMMSSFWFYTAGLYQDYEGEYNLKYFFKYENALEYANTLDESTCIYRFVRAGKMEDAADSGYVKQWYP